MQLKKSNEENTRRKIIAGGGGKGIVSRARLSKVGGLARETREGIGHHSRVVRGSGGLLQVKVVHAVMMILYCWSWTSSGKALELRTTLSALL